jgi:hypothetical protein
MCICGCTTICIRVLTHKCVIYVCVCVCVRVCVINAVWCLCYMYIANQQAIFTTLGVLVRDFGNNSNSLIHYIVY